MSQRTGFISDESYFWHDTGNGTIGRSANEYIEPYVHSENPETKRRIKNLVERCGLMKELKEISPRSAKRSEIEWFHGSDYIDEVKELSDTVGGIVGKGAIVGKGSYEIALKSTGGVMTAIDAVMAGEVENAYALVRPPGHHAEKDVGMGYCIFNNVVIAAEHARKTHGLKRILILDWDAHHGNGTEQAFYSDNEILFISLHQDNYYPPQSGFAETVGEEDGEGYNVNIPLPAGTGDVGYLMALENIVKPIAEQFKPELILISAGQDANKYDPKARMTMTADGYLKMTEVVKNIADTHCEGRLVVCHEGGYNAEYVPFCTLRIIETLSGIDTGVADPFTGSHQLPAEIKSYEKEAIDEVIKIQSRYWKLND